MQNKRRTIFHNGTIVDGIGGMFVGYVGVEQSGIVGVGRGDIPQRLATADARQIDLGGRTVLPGLIDCHVHLSMNAEAKTRPLASALDKKVAMFHAAANALNTLHGGVTTVRDCGTPAGIDFALRRASEEGLCITPRLLLSGQALCMTGGHGWQFLGAEADGPDQLRRAARQQLKAGADNIKLIATGGILTPGTDIGRAQFTVDEMRAAVEEAHNAGKISAAHAHGPEGIKNATRAGIDSVEHAYFIDDEGIDLMLEHGTTVVATSAAVRNVVRFGIEAGIPEDAVNKANSAIAAHVSGFKRAFGAGVKMAMGTDSGVPFTRHGKNLDELSYLVEMGLSPLEAIRVATLDSARLLQLEDQVGSLQEGKSADLIIVNGNPVDDISILQDPENIRQVVLNSRVVADRDASQYLVGTSFGNVTA